MSNESTPIGNVIHMGLTDGTKSDPISEVAEYFLQEREDDLFKIEKNNLICIFVNTCLLRKNEEVQVVQTFKKRLKMNLIYVNAEKEFLKKLKNVSDPEKKRKIIGNLFIKIFEWYAKKIKNCLLYTSPSPRD